MKKTICIIAAALMALMPAKAQSNHVYIGASDGIIYTIAYALGSVFGSVISAPLAGESVSMWHLGCYSLGYERDLGTSGVSLGATATFMPTRYQIQKTETHEMVSDRTGCAYMAMADCRYSYLRRRSFNLFSMAQVGAVYMGNVNGYGRSSDEDIASDLAFAFQINPIGIRFGGSHLGGYVALGIGHLGIFNAGLTYGF